LRGKRVGVIVYTVSIVVCIRVITNTVTIKIYRLVRVFRKGVIVVWNAIAIVVIVSVIPRAIAVCIHRLTGV
jgi:hypothetical protein